MYEDFFAVDAHPDLQGNRLVWLVDSEGKQSNTEAVAVIIAGSPHEEWFTKWIAGRGAWNERCEQHDKIVPKHEAVLVSADEGLARAVQHVREAIDAYPWKGFAGRRANVLPYNALAAQPCQRAEWGEFADECASQEVCDREVSPVTLCVSCQARFARAAAEPEFLT